MGARARAAGPLPEGGHVAAAVAAAGAAAQTAFDGHRLAHLVFAPGARAAVAHARARGLALVVITNGHHRVQRDKLAAVRAHELFPDPSAIIVGGGGVAGGREKPSREIFLKACRVAGCAPNEAAHVGDSLATDVQVMRALLIGVALPLFPLFQPRVHAFRRSRDRSSLGVRRRAEPKADAPRAARLTSLFPSLRAAAAAGGVDAALRASVWVNPAGTPAPPGAAQPTHVIRDIGGLSAVIDALLAEDAAAT